MKTSPTASAPSLAERGQWWCLPLMMGMIVSCSRVFSGACSENSWGERGACVSTAAADRPAWAGHACT